MVDDSGLSEEQRARVKELQEQHASAPPRRHVPAPAIPVSNDEEIPSPDVLRARADRVEEDRQEAEARRRRRQAEDRVIRDDRWPALIPPEWRDARIEELPEALHELALDWLSLDPDERRNLLLFGPVGVGKTFVAYSVAREAYIRHETVAIYQISVLLDRLRPNSGYPDTLQRCLDVDVLVLDDLGAERSTDWADERLAIIIDHRWQWHRSIVLTTNVEPSQLPEMIGERLSSRLLHGSTPYRLTGDDLRLA